MLMIIVTIAQAVMVGLILKNQRHNTLLLMWAVGFLLLDLYLLASKYL